MLAMKLANRAVEQILLPVPGASQTSTDSEGHQHGSTDIVSHSPLSFLDLPAEIRVMVYANLVREEHHSIEVPYTGPNESNLNAVEAFNAPAAPAFLLTNRKLSNEYTEFVRKTMRVYFHSTAVNDRSPKQRKPLATYIAAPSSFLENIRHAEIEITHWGQVIYRYDSGYSSCQSS